MTDYLDNNNKKLEKGFYQYRPQDISQEGQVWYFSGEYDSPSGKPIMKNERDKVYFNENLTSKLRKMCKEEVESKINFLKNKTSWMEKKLKEE
jgi:hypothetical protein